MSRIGKAGKKGKKKALNVLEKEAKGLNLNRVDRKRIVKIRERQAQQDILERAVRSELDQFETLNNDEENGGSLGSESSFGSQAVNIGRQKRVSFAGKEELEKTKLFDKKIKDVTVTYPQDAITPLKGILRSKASSSSNAKSKDSLPPSPKRRRMARTMEEPQPEDTECDGTDEVEFADVDEDSNLDVNDNKENRSATSINSIPGVVIMTKPKIVVTKKVKKQLLAMPRKERKAYLKSLKAERKPILEKSQQMIQLWEKIRSGRTPTAEKDECVTKLVGLVKGNAAKVIYAHDTCRVIECLVALQRPGINNMLFNELSSEIVRMTRNKYARFFVLKMLKYGSKQQREIIINAFHGHVVALMRIIHAAEVLETAYNEYANQQQRYNIVSEFYGKEFVVFRSASIRTLDDIVTAEPAKKKSILQYMEEQLQVMVEKVTVRHSLVHKILLEFLNYADQDQLINMVDSMKDKIPEIIHTPEGSEAAMKIVWNASAKDRKLIVKNFKDLSVKAAMEHYGHRVLLSIFDSVDDTVLVNKFIVSELANEMKKLVLDTWGENVIHYIIHPRDGRGMDRNEIRRLEQGDSNAHSKKSKSDRYAEIFNGIQEALFCFLAANMEELIFEHKKKYFIGACLETPSEFDLFERKVQKEYRQRCYRKLIEIAQQEFIPMDSDRLHLIEHPSGGFVLQNALRCDPNLPDDEKLSVLMVSTMKPCEYGCWIACNKGCHILAKMIDVAPPLVKEKISKAIDKQKLKKYTTKGALSLMERLK